MQSLEDRSHPRTLLSRLGEQRSHGLFCDVTVVVEDVKFRAHGNILAACSGYFRNALTSPEAWSSGQVLELRDLKSEVFASILDFIYCSEVTSPGPEPPGGLVAAGKRLGIPFLEKLAEQQAGRVGSIHRPQGSGGHRQRAPHHQRLLHHRGVSGEPPVHASGPDQREAPTD